MLIFDLFGPEGTGRNRTLDQEQLAPATTEKIVMQGELKSTGVKLS